MASLLRPRTNNRIVMLCTSLNDHTSWPFWKFLQMKKIKGVTDLVMLAFTTESGTFEARIDGTDYTLKNLEHVKEFRPEVLDRFLDKWHIPGHTYFVYGGHGMGDYLELESETIALQAHELASMMGTKEYNGILFDACFMADLDAVYYLRKNTRYIGACEGYMWEHDTALDAHIFNTYTASAMSRFKDTLSTFQLIQRDYCGKSLRGDFAVLDTTHSAELYHYCQRHVIPRIYDRVSFFTAEQQEQLEQLAHDALGPDADADDMTINATLASPEAAATAAAQRAERLRQAIQYEHSLYPSEVSDKHILDLFQYLADIAREEADESAGAEGSVPLRTACADRQGRLPDAMRPSQEDTLDRLPSSRGLDLFRKVVVSHQVPKDEAVYATKLGGLSIVAPELSTLSKTLHRTNYHRQAFRKKAKEFEGRLLEGVEPDAHTALPASTAPSGDDDDGSSGGGGGGGSGCDGGGGGGGLSATAEASCGPATVDSGTAPLRNARAASSFPVLGGTSRLDLPRGKPLSLAQRGGLVPDSVLHTVKAGPQ